MCDHYFCAECMDSHFKHKESNITECSICHTLIQQEEIRRADTRLEEQLGNLDVVWLKCEWTGPLSTLALHTCELPITSESFETSVLDSTDHHMLHSTPMHSNLTERMEMETQTSLIEQELKTQTFAKDTSIQSTLKKSLASPLSKEKEKVHTH